MGQAISDQAKAVLTKMQSPEGFLIGAVGDDKPFLLDHDQSSEKVSVEIAAELIESGLIREYKDLGDGRSMYVPVYIEYQ